MRIILLDDEQLALDYLEFQLKRISNVDIIGKFSDPVIAKEHIVSREVDLVFMDIQLPEISGIELAEQLLEIKPQLNIVFATAFNDFAAKAFDLDALDYIVKPIDADRLGRTMRRVRERMRLNAAHAVAPTPEGGSSTDNKRLYITVFRQVSLRMDARADQPVPIHWRTSRSRELFLYLLQHRGQLVRKSVLIELLWPENEQEKVYSHLYTAIYHVRKTLDQFGAHFQISSTMEGYTLNIAHVELDVEEWERRIREDKPINAGTIDEYGEWMKLYTGDYLQEYDYWWAESERQRLKQAWLRIAFQMADWHASHGSTDKAIALYLDICGRHPQAEEAHFALMKIYASQDNHLSVNRQFRLLVNILQEELNEQPSPYIAEWYDNWRKTIDGE